MKPRDLIATVAATFDVTLADVLGQSRMRHVAEARQAAAWVLRRAIPAISLEQIGRLLGGRDHTTIIHSLAQVERRCAADPQLRAVLHSLLPQAPLVTHPRVPLDQAGSAWWVAQSRDSFFVRAA